MTTKICRVCKRELPATREYFPIHSIMQDGLNTRCHECKAKYAKEYYQRSKDKIDEYQRQNADKIRERERKYWAANRERKRANLRDFFTRNPEKVSEYNHRKYKKNPDKQKAQLKAWAKAHPDYIKAVSRRKNMERRGVPLDETAKVYVEILRRDPCAYCGSYDRVEIDHILAITRGGDSSWSNLAAACRNCNNRKNNKSVLSMFMDGLR